MISTVIPSTFPMTGSFTIIGIIVLITLLVQKELITSTESSRARKWSRILNIGIVPLLLAFALIVATKVAEALR